MKKILQKNERVLRRVSHEVRSADIKTKKIKTVLKEMSEALKSQSDGVAIAAPQIGYTLRIFVISGKIFAKDFGKKKPAGEGREEKLLNENNLIPPAEKPKKINDMVFINPEISKLSKEK